MRMNLKKIVCINLTFILLSLVFSTKIFAEEISSMEKPDICGEIILDITETEYLISLEEALMIALERNFDIKTFNAIKNRSKWKYYRSITDFIPDINYEYNMARISGTFLVGGIVPVEVSEVPIESNFTLNYNLSVKKYFDLKETYYQFNSQKNELEFTKEEIILKTSKNYFELLQAKLNIEILKVNLEQVEEQLKITEQRLLAGVGTKFDVLRAQADLAIAKQELIQAENAYRLTQAQLANTIGIPVLIRLIPNTKDTLIKEIFADCFTVDQAKEIAMKNRADLKSQKLMVEAARQRKKAGYSTYIPEINIFGLLANQGTADVGLFGSKTIGFAANWRGLDGLGLKGITDIKASGAEVEEEQFKYINKSRNIEERIIETFFNTITSRELIDTTAKELESAEESREIAVIRLEAGVGTFLDVLEAQSTFTEARINNLSSIINYNISQIELLFEMGVISTNNIFSGFQTGTLKANPNINKTIKYNEKIQKQIQNKETKER